ncbi:MAG: hypothetical protein K0U84_20820 [Actinomycetia bacterium]|nr:hypothetical protein [Actinomycetes bacterium]
MSLPSSGIRRVHTECEPIASPALPISPISLHTGMWMARRPDVRIAAQGVEILAGFLGVWHTLWHASQHFS